MRFEDVLEIKNGRNQRAVENPKGKYPIYGSGGIMGYADDYICDAQTVIVGRKGSINNPLFVEEPFWNVDTAFGLSANRDVLLPRFLYYFCKKFDFERLNKAVTIPSLTKSDLLKIEIDLPNLKQQQDVVDRLVKVERIIALRKQELRSLDDLIKARFVELFGDMTENPNGWEAISLGKVCDVRDGTHDSPKYFTEGYPLVTSKNVTSGKIDFADCSLICEEDYNKINERSKVDYGDILMPMIGTVGKPVIVDVEAEFAIKNVALIKFYEDSKVTNIFVKALLQSDYFDRTVISKIRGGTQKFIALGDIRKLEICLPPMETQKQFTVFVKQVDKSKVTIQKSLEQTQLLFDSLMQEYFDEGSNL
ncbi:MAG: restriction endonuclease subunit S [Dorea sp.]|nr:restriction endonuclease subunit S [Dorea sp.]